MPRRLATQSVLTRGGDDRAILICCRLTIVQVKIAAQKARPNGEEKAGEGHR